MLRPFVLVLVSFAACAGAPPEPTPGPDLASVTLPNSIPESQKGDVYRLLLELDQAIDSYQATLDSQGSQRRDTQLEKIERFLRDTVLDTGARQLGQGLAQDAGWQPGRNFHRLTAIAADQSSAWQQGIALAALGFSGKEEAMPTILQGAQLANVELVDRAVFGLAVLRAPKTPPGVVAAVVMRPEFPEDSRVAAAWALCHLQTNSDRTDEFAPLWLAMTEQRDRLPAGVQLYAVRGLGQLRDGRHADVVAPFLQHPMPLVRCASTIALARMNAQAHWRDVLALLAPQETNQNVRLHASKALQALAGGVDHGYDVGAWQKQFDRGVPATAGRTEPTERPDSPTGR